MGISDFSAVELQRLARTVLLRYLQVQTGELPAEVLAPFVGPLTVDEEEAIRQADPERQRVAHADIGPVALLRLRPDRAYGTAAVSRPADRAPVVLSVEFDVKADRVLATRLGEVDFARPSSMRRSDERRVAPGQALPRPPDYMENLLGDLPTTAEALRRWVTAAAVIDTYRERHGIDDVSSAFGPVPPDPWQWEERERALDAVRQLARDIEAIEPQQERAVGKDRPAAPELGL